jgi:uncharacterized membrane protein
MRKSSKELKRIARENLTGHYPIPMGAFIVSSMITLAIELPFSMLQNEYSTTLQVLVSYLARVLISLLSVVLSAGLTKIHLNMARGKEYTSSQLFDCFKKHPDRYLIAGFFLMLLIFVISLPIIGAAYFYMRRPSLPSIVTLLVVGLAGVALIIYIELRFQLLYYVILEHEEMSIKDAFTTAAGLMKGNVGRLFYMLLGFIGLDILCLLSLGIGLLWVAPYQMQTVTLFYLDVIGELPERTSTESFHSQPNYFNQYI